MASRSQGLRVARELLALAWTHKKWWLIPVVAAGLLVLGLVTVSASPASPFLYTLF